MKRNALFALSLSAILLGSGLSGCGQSGEPNNAGSGGTSTENTTLASSDKEKGNEVRTIRVLGPDTNTTWDTRDKQDSFKALQAMLSENHLKIDFEVVANEQYTQILQTRMAAAKDLPDMVSISQLDTATILNLGKKGILLDVKGLVNEYSNGNVESFGGKYFPDMWKASTAPDGNAYWLPNHQYITYKNEAFHSNLTQMIRSDWLKKLGLEKPQTLDAFRDVLIKFRDNDANGNGQPDECMLYTPDFTYFAPSFGLPAGLVMIDNTDNTAKCPWLMKEELVEFISYVKSLIDENLIDVDAFDKSGEVTAQKMQENKVSAVCDWALGTWNDAYVKDVGGIYEPVMLGKNQGEIPPTLAEDSYSVVGKLGITKNCADKQAVADLLDMCYTEDYSLLYFYGVEGVTYTVNEDGTKVFDPHFKDKDFYEQKATGSYMWGGRLPGNQLSTWESYILGMVAERPDLEPFSEDYCIGQKYWYNGESLLGVPTDEETQTLTKIQNDITTYSKETLTKLCLGQYDLGNIDEYINTIKALGIEDYVKIYQARHDRYQNAK